MPSRKWHFNIPKSFRNVIVPGLLVIGSLLTTWEARGAWIPVGDASAPDGAGYVQITPPLTNQVGAVWLDVPLVGGLEDSAAILRKGLDCEEAGRLYFD